MTRDAQMSDERRETIDASHVSRLTSPHVSCLASRAPWPRKRLEEVADFCLGKMLDQKKNRGTSMPYLANVDVRWGQFDLSDLREMPFEESEKERYGLRFGDIVMCEGGEPGRCAVWKDERPGMMFQKALFRIRPHQELLPEFLYYYFVDTGRRNAFSPFFTGSTIKHLPREKLSLVEVPLPPLSEQRRIVGILSAYDDLIENNRKRIALLEESARSLYKEWFVRLRFPGHERVPVEDGVPKGWKRTTVGDVCTSIRDVANPKRVEDGTPYIGLEHMPRRSITLSEWSTADDVTSGKLRFREGEILFGKIRPYFHKVGIALVDGVASSDAIVIRPNAEELLPFVLLAVSSDAFVAATAQGMREGSKMPRADWKQMQEYPLPLPPKSMLAAFNEIIFPVLRQCSTLARQSRALAAARDALLPRLMKGGMA